jgi:hypothetical protein
MMVSQRRCLFLIVFVIKLYCKYPFEGLFEITEITEAQMCQPLNREFGESFIYLVHIWSRLSYTPFERFERKWF